MSLEVWSFRCRKGVWSFGLTRKSHHFLTKQRVSWYFGPTQLLFAGDSWSSSTKGIQGGSKGSHAAPGYLSVSTARSSVARRAGDDFDFGDTPSPAPKTASKAGQIGFSLG